jgi:hypothetical protein
MTPTATFKPVPEADHEQMYRLLLEVSEYIDKPDQEEYHNPEKFQKRHFWTKAGQFLSTLDEIVDALLTDDLVIGSKPITDMPEIGKVDALEAALLPDLVVWDIQEKQTAF